MKTYFRFLVTAFLFLVLPLGLQNTKGQGQGQGQGQGTPENKTKTVEIAITSKNEIEVNGKNVKLKELTKRLKSLGVTKRWKIRIRGDKESDPEVVVGVVEELVKRNILPHDTID